MPARRLVAVTAAAVAALATAVVAAPPAAAATGPRPLHDRVAAQPVYDLDSDPAGTVFVTAGGEVRLVRAPMTPASEEVSLGSRGPGDARYVGQEVSITAGRVAVPVLPSAGAFATQVRWCLVDVCPALSTLTTPPGYRYLGNAGDVAVVHNPDTNTLGLQPWISGPLTTVALGAGADPLGAYGDSGGVVLWHPSRAVYVARPSLAVTPLTGALAYLTPSYVLSLTLAGSDQEYAVHRTLRGLPSSPPAVVATSPADWLAEPDRLVGTDTAAAWTARYDEPAGEVAPDQVSALYTVQFGGAAQDAGLAEWWAVAPLEDEDTFVVHRDGAAGRAFYAVQPATGTAAPVHALPDVAAAARAIWVSGDRVAYTDDSTPGGAAYVRDAAGGVPGDETLVSDIADTVSLSAPFVAVGKNEITDKAGAGWAHGVFAGRVGGTLSHRFGHGDPVLSGRRLVTGYDRTVLAGPDEPYAPARGGAATVSGEYYFTTDPDGRIRRHDFRTGAVTTVSAASCSGCGTDRSRWQLWGWGEQLLYAIDLGAQGRKAGLWDGVTGTTKPLPMLAAGWTRLAYRDGLLLVHRAGDGVRLYDLDAGTDVLVDATGDLPYGNGLGPRLVAWRDADGTAVVQPVEELLPGYTPTTKHLNEVVPPGLVTTETGTAATWAAEWYLTDDSPWQLVLRQGDPAGAVVRTMSGTSAEETVAPRWNGADDDGDPLPHGWYAWTLTTGAGTRSGTVFLSRYDPPRPTLTAPTLVSDVSATPRFTLRWDGAPAGYRYYLVGPGGSLRTTAETRTVTPAVPSTIRYTLYVEDPAGRKGLPAKSVTVTPFDDNAGKPVAVADWARSYASQHWLGSQLRSSKPGAKISFSVAADGVWLIGAKGPSYGRYRVTVDGKSFVYDAYSPVVRFRQVLFKTALPWARHAVTVEVLATPGRTRVGVDGLGARRADPYEVR